MKNGKSAVEMKNEKSAVEMENEKSAALSFRPAEVFTVENELRLLRFEVISLMNGDGCAAGEVFWVKSRFGLTTLTDWATKALDASDSRISRSLVKPISALGLSFRPKRCLDSMGITIIGELVKKTKYDLLGRYLGYKYFGDASLLEVETALLRLGLQLAEKAEWK